MAYYWIDRWLNTISSWFTCLVSIVVNDDDDDDDDDDDNKDNVVMTVAFGYYTTVREK